MGPFNRTNARMDQLGFVRGPARLLAAPLTTSAPTTIGDVLRLTGTDTSEVQSLTITGTPTSGTFRLTFRGVSSASLTNTATAAAVQAALDGMSTIGFGNTLCAGGPLPTAVTITFQNALAGQDVPALAPTSVVLVGGTTPAVVVSVTTPGIGLFDPIGSWFDLGGTKNGIVPSYNNAEEEFTIDQQQIAIGSQQNSHEWAFQTSLVEVTPENLAIAWDQGAVTLNTTPAIPEKRLGFGTPRSYTQRRVAIVHRRHTGLLRMHFFRIMQRSPIEASLTYTQTGEQQSVPFRMRALVDELVSSDTENVGFLLDQQA